jgi:hypothetical protein
LLRALALLNLTLNPHLQKRQMAAIHLDSGIFHFLAHQTYQVRLRAEIEK